MRAVSRVLIAISLLLGSSLSQAAPDWYVGYSFIYNESGNLCSFMRFRADSFTVQQADTLYAYLADRLAAQAADGSTFLHTAPSTALARGESGEQMAQEFLSKGVGACTVAGDPVAGVMFISAFGCDYQNQPQMCMRLYVDTGDKDATASGIARGPTGVNGTFVRRPVWDTAAGAVYAGKTDLPYAVDSALTEMASGLRIFRE